MFVEKQYKIVSGTGIEYSYRNQWVTDFNSITPRIYDNLRIVRVISGSCTWVIDTRRYHVQARDMVILNNAESRYQCDPDPEKPFIQEVVEFLPVFAYPCLQCLELFYRKRGDSFSNVIHPDSKMYQEIADCYERLVHETLSSNEYKNEAIRGTFLSLLVALSRNSMLDEQDKRKAAECCSLSNYNTVCESVKYIKKNIGNDLNLPLLARQFGMSSSYFSRIFSAIWGMSVSGYIRSQRIRATLELLKEKEINILDAALECGFKSSSGFYKAVHDVIGRTPRHMDNIEIL